MTDFFHVSSSCGLFTESMLVFAGNAPETSKQEARGGTKKAPSKKVSLGYSNILQVTENWIPLFDLMLPPTGYGG